MRALLQAARRWPGHGRHGGPPAGTAGAAGRDEKLPWPPVPHPPSPRQGIPMPCCSPSLRRTALLALYALLCGLAVPATPALAQEVYPSRPVSIVVGYPPGGSVDLVARTLAVE